LHRGLRLSWSMLLLALNIYQIGCPDAILFVRYSG
jgi:hypothetical protein